MSRGQAWTPQAWLRDSSVCLSVGISLRIFRTSGRNSHVKHASPHQDEYRQCGKVYDPLVHESEVCPDTHDDFRPFGSSLI